MLCGCGMALGWPKKKTHVENTEDSEEPSRIAEDLPQYSVTRRATGRYVFNPSEIIDEFRNRRSRAPSAETLGKRDSSHPDIKKEVKQ